jgi:PDGLE domain-containing protein
MKWFTILALAIAIGLAAAAAPFASSSPDGLNRVAADSGFAGRADDHGAVLDGYGDNRLAVGLAGFVGTIGVFAVGTAVAVVVRRR